MWFNVDFRYSPAVVTQAGDEVLLTGPVTTTIRLLGRAAVVRDDEEVTTRSRKSWALLALLALTHRPLSRRRVAGMLFDQADDPLGALRWTLAQLRRGLLEG